MSPNDLRALNLLRSRGIILSPQVGGEISWKSPNGLAPELKELLINHKAAIWSLLRAEVIAGSPVIRVVVRGGGRSPQRTVLVFVDDPKAPIWV